MSRAVRLRRAFLSIALGLAVTHQDLYSQEIDIFNIATDKGEATCALVDGEWLSGQVNKRGKFIAFSTKIKKLKKRRKNAPTKVKKKRIGKRLRKFKKLRRASEDVCALGVPDENGSMTPTPSSSPSPVPGTTPMATPTPTPDPAATPTPTPIFQFTPVVFPTLTPTPMPTPTSASTGNFDENGNVTGKGKALFKIPANLEGNVAEGQEVFDNLFCGGCHMEKSNRDFEYLRTAVANPPMNYSKMNLPDRDLADLTAYLNRSRVK